MGKVKIAAIAAAILAAGAGGFCVAEYAGYRDFASSGVYMDGTILSINGEDMEAGGMTPHDAYGEYREKEKDKYSLKLHVGENEYTVDISGYMEHSLAEGDFEKCAGKESFVDYMLGNAGEYQLEDDARYTGGAEEEFAQILEEEDYGFQPAQDAYLDKDTIEVVPEAAGTELDKEKAVAFFTESIGNGASEIDFRREELYKQPSVTEGEIREKYAKVLEILEWRADYKISDYVIEMKDYKDRITVNDDGTYAIDKSFLKDAVLGLSKTIDKTYGSIKFKSAKDGAITVKGGTYGQIMSNAKEIAYLQGKLDACESVTGREPEWICRPLKDGEAPSEYVEVDLSEQHVWHYKDGKVCCETDCVTGDTGKGRGTPAGAYYVSEMIPGKYLIGTGYKTWVNRWMRLTNTGIGLHDAGWRGSFGGNIYKYNGSHGCVNLPAQFAYKLYGEISIGTLVVIHS